MTRRAQRYGWIPDLPDQRDHMFAAAPEIMLALPPTTDLRPDCPPVYDQGQLGACTANAIAGAMEYDQRKQKLKEFVPSRLFIYYNERVIEGTVASDSGAMLRDGIKSVADKGACTETEWPYAVQHFTDSPSQPAYAAALANRAIAYQRVSQLLPQLKGCLAGGYPFVFGFTVYDSFESDVVAASGEVPMPAPGEKIVGGHAVVAVGYDDGTQRFLVRNSWGSGWGQNGYFTMPYAYLADGTLADDFWVIRQLSGSEAELVLAARRRASVSPMTPGAA